ncbi:MAG: hypothetical protein M0R46_11170 [Candidatus Muirbacterium halophilum]|nr:hypothetical protein [Candidatus Muirbacterium halophilum]
MNFKKTMLTMLSVAMFSTPILADTISVNKLFLPPEDVKIVKNTDERFLLDIAIVYLIRKYMNERQKAESDLTKNVGDSRSMVYSPNAEIALNDFSDKLKDENSVMTVFDYINKNMTEGNLPQLGAIVDVTLEFLDTSQFRNRKFDKVKKFFKEVSKKSQDMTAYFMKPENRVNYVLYNRLEIAVPGENVFVYEEDEFSDDYIDNVEFETTRGETTGRAATDYSKILSNEEFIEESMTSEEIQTFLNNRKSCLKNEYNNTFPSSIIHDVCVEIGVNPKVMLVTIQKEKGLVSRETATKSRLDWAMGVGCYDNGKKNLRFKGLDKQVKAAGQTFRTWYDDGVSKDISKNNYKMKINYNKEFITLKNEATYSLYRYTPHSYDRVVFDKYGKKSGGNYLFVSVWKNFFKSFK